MQSRCFSGIQPTGVPHLGNILGAMRPWVAMQQQAHVRTDVILSIVDLHAMTVPFDPAELRRRSMSVAAAVLACGVDPEKAVLFRQSQVREHTELAWVLGSLTPMGWLQRMTHFKEKSASVEKAAKRGPEPSREVARMLGTVSLDLFAYPVLQAADILLYRAARVPVGEDQRQHLELAREIARVYNGNFSDASFAFPEPLMVPPPLAEAARIMSLRDASKKMSKSDPVAMSRIDLTDDADTIRAKLRRATTDSLPGMEYDPEKRPERSNLLVIFAACEGRGRSPQEVAADFAGSSNTAEFKDALADVVTRFLAPIAARYSHLVAEEDRFATRGGGPVSLALHQGEQQARTIAAETMQHVRRQVGIAW
jgi:tryptophanyl-tRNA synthetase